MARLHWCAGGAGGSRHHGTAGQVLQLLQEQEALDTMARWQQALANIHLEPVVFLFFTCYGIFFVTSQQLYIEKACKVNLNYTETVCDNITHHEDVQVEAQKLVSTVQVISSSEQWMISAQGLNGALQSLPTIVVAFFAGPLSDMFSRKPLILISLSGYILLNVIYMVNAFWFYELKVSNLNYVIIQSLRWNTCCLSASRT